MPAPETFTAAAVRAWNKLPDTADDAAIWSLIMAAVTSQVDRLPDKPTDADGIWTGETTLAAVMLAARLFRRRNSPSGVEAFTEAGATYIARYDPDIARALRIDSFAPPRVG